MRIEIRDDHGTIVSVEQPGVVTIDQVVESLVIPALLGVGFHPDSVNSALGVEVGE